MRTIVRVVVLIALCVGTPIIALQVVVPDVPSSTNDRVTLFDAQHSFYNGRYGHAAAQALVLRAADPDDLAAYELRTSALLFQLKGALAINRDKQKALKQCGECADWLDAFLSETTRGVALAHERLLADPQDEAARFFLGKLNLNYVWLQLGTLGRRKGWNDYWEARRSLDAVLVSNPRHVRAMVARAWIDYIVDTRMPFGTEWLLGGGNRKKALIAVRDAAQSPADFYTRAEAGFSLWDMLVRERKFGEATEVARGLLEVFPENRELAAFLAVHAP